MSAPESINATPEPGSAPRTTPKAPNSKRRGPKNGKKTTKPKPKNTKEEQKDPTQTSKFLQLSKLVKKYKPVTINGIPTKSITEQIKQREVENADYFKNQYTNSERLSFVQKYLLEYMKNQPEAVIYLSFVIRPSDPEFPFDLELLKLNLSIPANYPKVKAQRPSVVVLNDDIPRGFAVNIELGFRRIVDIAMNKVSDEEIELVEGAGLKSQVMTLDKYLELFLKQEKRETIKFVKTKPKPVLAKQEKPRENTTAKVATKPETKSSQVPIVVSPETASLRAQLLEEMNNKLGSSIKLFKKSALEHRYKVTLPAYDKSLPELWKLNNSVDIMMSVPHNYPQANIGVSVPNNFNTNLILKYKKSEGDQQLLLETARHYKQLEKNLAANVASFVAESPSLVQRLNWMVNNLARFCAPASEFQKWVQSANTIQVSER
ncbi:uncharacterized protein CANTADRAFT_27114 [Suhomyces tanzawaensis NRRL Y-17324]|uniref:Uncharacterized protein n=1 Tax=Suhomyces tanzawaensis NRRL Y-17324 TaxID=984487 RepID=A0A1E4SCJ6_9ASCO|nr:uncharacterized protein CANTADRAFT_27114 [Suhomyces tanzawaensis NRRL Y-17324]ODV77188.1 hypothetical protein CANTADRAFT_27114 [Suhomyces tanzawaensis NRRL Y-17324]